MNIETGEIINENHKDFKNLLERGALMPIDEALETSKEELKETLINLKYVSKSKRKKARQKLKNYRGCAG